jgi:GR25 family glycosyltransferase involved in LPS biosynthesis
MKILYVAPHLSTGGMPQYLYKQISYFYKNNDIEVVDVTNSGGDSFVVQKNKISNLVPIHTLSQKYDLLDVVANFNPDVIHYHEIPQDFLSVDILNELFKEERTHFNIVTTHSSFTNPDEITHHPDKYVFVCEWSKNKFNHLEIPSDIWEYPIEKYTFNKESAQKELGLDPTWKHVLHVGLFTSGKNQGELFTIARQLEKYKIKFHFVGNQADNFRDYWEPLMNHKPDNCIVWGECNNVDLFYSAVDLFYFPSIFELSPIAIKEALSYGLPCLFRKLDTYLDMYDNNPNVSYITSDIASNKALLMEKLLPEFNEIPGWFAYQDLYADVVKAADNNDIFVEVGAWFGKSTNYMVQQIRESKKNIQFTTVDTRKGTEDEDIHQEIVGSFAGDIFYEFVNNLILSNNYGYVNMIKDTSKNASNQFQNNSIDFIMIDAGHSYEAVIEDLNIWYNKVKPGGIISGDDYGVFDGVTRAANEYFYGQFHQGFRSFVRKKPRIQVKHMLTKLDDMRERVSIQSLQQLAKYGIDYHPIINEVYEGIPPSKNCRRPEHISKDNKPSELYPGAGLGWITGRHYGCYLAHRNALETIDEENYDYTLIFEADAFIYTGLEEFVDIIHKACFISERDDVYFISFANNPSIEKHKINELFSQTGPNQDLAHCYLIPNRTKGWWMNRLNDCEWDVGDLWFNHVFYHYPMKRYTTNKMYLKQAEGYSLLDLKYKDVQ